MRVLRRGLHAPTVNGALLLDQVSGGRQSEARRMNPQQILHQFEDAVEKAGRVCALAKGRPVNGIVACCIKLISAEKQKAAHIAAAASVALAQLDPTKRAA
jgi:hypothetical protein